MKKQKINLFIVNSCLDKQHVLSKFLDDYLKEYEFKFCDLDRITITSPSNPLYFSPQECFSIFPRVNEDGAINIFITSLPIKNNLKSRISLFRDPLSIIISMHGLTKKNEAKYLCALIYASIIEAKYLKEDHDGTACVVTSRITNSLVDDGFCSKCKNVISFNGIKERYTLDSILQDRKRDNGIHIIIMHGINTFAEWTTPVISGLKEYGFTVTVPRYPKYSIPRFLLSCFFKKTVANFFYDEYTRVRSEKPDYRISVIAHSNGALSICRALQLYGDIQLDKIIFYGAVAPSRFPWYQFVANERVGGVLNECGDKDVIAALGRLIPCSGSAGAHFFEGPGCDGTDHVVNIRYSNSGHSSKLNLEHCNDVWVNYLLGEPWFVVKENVKASKLVSWLGYRV